MKITSAFSISVIEFVIAPEPNMAARLATVGCGQRRAQMVPVIGTDCASNEFLEKDNFSSLVQRRRRGPPIESAPNSFLISFNFDDI